MEILLCSFMWFVFYLLLRLAEKKAQIGYTYEDSTVTETDAVDKDKGDEEDSENSESEEDEVIPDIGVSHFNCAYMF